MEQPNRTSSLDKAIDLLFHLHDAGRAQGVTAIARALNLPKSSVHRLASNLSRRGLLERDERGRMRMGPALITLGLGTLERDPLVEIAHPVLSEAAFDLGETVFLTAPRGRRILILDKVEGSGFLRATPTVGQSVPAHATAVGKLTLAFAAESLPPPDQHAERFTRRTLGIGAPLQKAINEVRSRGYAENHGEWIDGLSVIAAPIFGWSDSMVGTLAVAATTPRMKAMGCAEVADFLVSAAHRVEARLGRARGNSATPTTEAPRTSSADY